MLTITKYNVNRNFLGAVARRKYNVYCKEARSQYLDIVCVDIVCVGVIYIDNEKVNQNTNI